MSERTGKKVIVVMPARQAAATLERTFSEIPQDEVDEIILVDDSSTDETVELARELPLTVIWHPHQVGYGGNQKTCYLEALQRGADVVVMLHPDGQYEPGLIPSMVEPIVNGEADLVLGSRLADARLGDRSRHAALEVGRQPLPDEIENRIMGTTLTEAHTGYRAYSRELLLEVPFLRNSLDFVFDSEVLMQASHMGFRIDGSPGPLPLLRRDVVGRFQDRCRLRPEDPVGRGPADPAPQPHPEVTQVRA